MKSTLNLNWNRAAKLAAGAGLLGLVSVAQAHPGHGAEGLAAGLSHPFGADHLLAMVAVGIWSVFALPAQRAWQGPATFMLALVAGAALGVAGLTLPFLEHAIALSVVMFGVMLIAARSQWPGAVGLGLVAASALLHGVAHGAEAPTAGGLAGYALGFLATTATLHLGGVAAGLSLRRWVAAQAPRVVVGLGLALGGAGVALLSQV